MGLSGQAGGIDLGPISGVAIRLVLKLKDMLMVASPVIQPSASVILVQPGGAGQGLKVFLLRRQSKSSFMPGRFVFPGGRVEPSDGPDPQDDATLRYCALRELWEEAGVILADDPQKAAGSDPEARKQARQALQKGDWSLDQAMSFLGLKPALDQLFPYARWITPQAREKRFDTVFYVAAMPEGQEASSDRQETTQGVWISPARALAQGSGEDPEGEVSLAPPQVRILGDLNRFESLQALREYCGHADMSPILPYMHIEGKSRVILFPWDRDYEAKHPGPEAERGAPCQAHEATRLISRQGRWLPHCKPKD